MTPLPFISSEDPRLRARFAAGDEEALALVFERHRRVLRRQAARLLRGSGYDPDDILQDVFLRASAALRAGVVPIEPRAWLSRLVRNACLDELRRARSRPVGDVELEAMASGAAAVPDELAHRAEAHALLGDMVRLPDRQRSVLVLSALEGLSHEEVASELDTTVHTTRSLLARARENLRRTAVARETACSLVQDALEEASSAGVRASEIARRHLWTCPECRTFQKDLRTEPSRLRRLASWSPWAVLAQVLGGGGVATVQKVAVGACCALVVGGSAVTVPVMTEHNHHRESQPLAVATVEPAEALHKTAHVPRTHTRKTVAPPATLTPVSAPRAVTTASAAPKRKPRAAKPRVKPRATASQIELTQLQLAMRTFYGRHPSTEEQVAMHALIRRYTSRRPGTRGRHSALRVVQMAAAGRIKITPTQPAPPKGKPAPTPVATPVVPPPTPTPTAAPTETPVPTPTPTPTETPSVAPTATPTATP